MDTLPDLRVTIAEGMEALAHSKAHNWRTRTDDLRRLYAGAETLRWCAEREAPTVEEMHAEIERLTDVIEAVEEIVFDVSEVPVSKRFAEIRDVVA